MTKVSELVSSQIGNAITNAQTWGGIIVNIKSFGAKGDGITDDTVAINNAISSIDTSGGRGGTVTFPQGTYLITDTINVPTRIKVAGAGSRSTIVNSSHPNVAFRFVDTDYSGISGMRIAIATNSATAIGIEVYSDTKWSQWNNFGDLEIVGYTTITRGQIGLWCHSINDTQGVVYNYFENIRIFSFHKPVVLDSHFEANVFNSLHVNGFGIDNDDTAIDATATACMFYGVWMGKGSSVATTLRGISYNATNCIFDAIADIGSGVAFFSHSGSVVVGVNANQFRASGTSGVTALGMVQQYPVFTSGTFTPVIAGSTTAGAGTYSTQQGTYTKIHDRVFFEIAVAWSGHTGTGDMQITGLPFTIATSEPQSAVWAFAYGLTITGQAYLFFPQNQTYGTVGVENNGSVSNAAMAASGTLRISGSYRTTP